jgi:hypothetical protein
MAISTKTMVYMTWTTQHEATINIKNQYQEEADKVLRAQLREIPRDGKNDVILDFAFTSGETRDEYRQIVEEQGARSQ